MATATERARRVLAIVSCAALVALAGACASIIPPASTPCPELSGWPPTGFPAPPAAIVIDHPPGTSVRIFNGTGAPIKIRYRVWTPLDCGLSPPFVGITGSVLAPDKHAQWSGNDLVPVAGPVFGGLEIWTHPCDAACSDPPDAFTSFELRKPLPGR